MAKKKKAPKRESPKLSASQIIFLVISAIIILTMILSLVAK